MGQLTREETWALKVHLEQVHNRLFTRKDVATMKLADYVALHELCMTEEGKRCES